MVSGREDSVLAEFLGEQFIWCLGACGTLLPSRAALACSGNFGCYPVCCDVGVKPSILRRWFYEVGDLSQRKVADLVKDIFPPMKTVIGVTLSHW
jgi:hypothetical protein